MPSLIRALGQGTASLLERAGRITRFGLQLLMLALVALAGMVSVPLPAA